MTSELRREMIKALPRLRAFALSLTRHAADADDLVQAACERALRGAEGFQPGGRVDSWMLRIVHNAFVDTYRRKRRETLTDPSSPTFEIVGEDGADTVEQRSDLAAVNRAIAALPEDQRSVLVLVCVDGLSYRDTSEVLGIPIGTVMSRLSRARQTVAGALQTPGQSRGDGLSRKAGS